MKIKYNLISKISDNFVVFRDDLYPFLGGGNKGRKMDFIAQDIFLKKANALVTTGGIQSNHCRAVAIFAAQNKLKCTLVLHGCKDSFETQTGNAKIMRLSGAEIIFVDDASFIGKSMDIAMDRYTESGDRPYYIWGGGHSMEGGYSYINAVAELKEYCEKELWYPDYIFHASGTGSTQSGILAGLDKFNFPNTRVIGVSVGRQSMQAINVVDGFYKELCSHYDITCTNREVTVLDEYLMGGYAQYSKELQELSMNSINKYGFTLDTCYTGKAFYGMLDYCKKYKLDQENILFWHTGGIFNFLAE